MSLIVIEQIRSKWDEKSKKNLINAAITIVLDYLIEKEKITKKDSLSIQKEIENGKEILKRMRELLFDLTNCPNLLQKDKFVLAKKLKDKELSRMHSKQEIKYGILKEC